MQHLLYTQYIASAIVSMIFILIAIFCIAHRIYNNPLMQRNTGLYFFAALIWAVVLVCGILDGNEFNDAITHEQNAMLVYRFLHEMDFNSLKQYTVPGNKFFQLIIGAYFYFTNALPWTVKLASAICGFMGVVCLTDIISRINPKKPVPTWMTLSIICLPSFIFWSTDLIKDGFTMCFNCYAAQMLLTHEGNGTARKTSQLSSIIALIFLTLLRPHHGVVWFAALSLGPAIAQKKTMKAICFGSLGVLGAMALYIAVPDIFEKIADDGLTSTMEERYTSRSHIGGSSLGPGVPIPFVTGALLLFARPYPGEVPGGAGLATSIETMWIGVFILCALYKVFIKQSFQITSLTVGCMVAVFIYCFLHTYTYNLGLLVRQKINVLPAVFILTQGTMMYAKTVTQKKSNLAPPVSSQIPRRPNPLANSRRAPRPRPSAFKR